MRCYNGCPDSGLQAKIDSRVAAEKRLVRRGMRAVYFPAEGMYLVFKGFHPVTEFHNSVEEAEAHAS